MLHTVPRNSAKTARRAACETPEREQIPKPPQKARMQKTTLRELCKTACENLETPVHYKGRPEMPDAG